MLGARRFIFSISCFLVFLPLLYRFLDYTQESDVTENAFRPPKAGLSARQEKERDQSLWTSGAALPAHQDHCSLSPHRPQHCLGPESKHMEASGVVNILGFPQQLQVHRANVLQFYNRGSYTASKSVFCVVGALSTLGRLGLFHEPALVRPISRQPDAFRLVPVSLARM